MLKKTAIITDSSSTIKPDEFTDIYVISMLITINDSLTYLDGREITTAKVYDYLQKGINIKTSLPLAKDTISILKNVLPKYDQIIMLPISSKLSGTYNMWKNIIETEFSDNNNIYIFDTLDVALSLKWLVLDVYKLCQTNHCIKDIESYINNWHSRVSCTVILNDLNQIRKGGRIDQIIFFITSILKIKPILHFHNGKNQIVSKVPTNKMAIERSFEIFNNVLHFKENNINIERIGFCNSFISADKSRKILKELKLVAKKYKIDKIEQSDITPIISCHTGNDAFSINILLKEKQ